MTDTYHHCAPLSLPCHCRGCESPAEWCPLASWGSMRWQGREGQRESEASEKATVPATTQIPWLRWRVVRARGSIGDGVPAWSTSSRAVKAAGRILALLVQVLMTPSSILVHVYCLLLLHAICKVFDQMAGRLFARKVFDLVL